MTVVLRWTGIVLGALVVTALFAFALVYARSQELLGDRYAIPEVKVKLRGDPEWLAEGRRLALVRGCMGGCHGKDGEGSVMFDKPVIARIVAPNLTTAVRKYKDEQLVVAIKHGVFPDGRSMLVMPSESWVHMTDDDLGRIVSYLKTLPVKAGPEGGVAMGPLGRIGMALGDIKVTARLIIDTVPPPEAKGEEATLGRYLARTICGHCHGTDLRGAANPEFASPNLRVTAAYSAEAFTALLRKGEAVGGRKLDMMRQESLAHLTHLTDAEIAALYSYLRTLQ